MKKLIFLFLAMILISCNSEDFKKEYESQKPKPNLSTPDNTVKSYWSFNIWGDTTSFYNMDTTLLEFYSASLKQYLLEKYNKRKNELKDFHYISKNLIDKVDIESDSRAIVLTKELSYKDDDSFDEAKYVFTKQGNKWLLDDIFVKCWNCNGTGETMDYSLYSRIKTTCNYCKGRGWKSHFYED